MLQKILLKQLRPHESVILVIREYIIAKFLVFSILMLLYFTLFFLMYPLISYGKITTLFFIFGVIAIIIYAVRTFIVWYLDVMLITPDRLIDIEQHGVFSKQVQEITWGVVEDVIYMKQGILQTIFNYGNVIIKTNNPEISFNLNNIYHPQQIRDIISDHAKKNT